MVCGSLRSCRIATFANNKWWCTSLESISTSDGHMPSRVADLGSQLRPEHAVVDIAPFPEVMQQRSEDQQVGTGNPSRENSCPRDGLGQVTIHRPDMNDRPRGGRSRTAPPLREKAGPTARLRFERLDYRYRVRAGGQQNQ